jgi:hypothetical protein
VITWHNRGTSEYPPRVRSELAPRYRRRDDGQRNRGIGTIRRVGHEIGHHPPRIRQRNCGRSGKYPPRYRASNSGQLAASIRPVNAMRRRPVIGRIRASGKPTSGVWQPAPKSGSEFGEPGRAIRPAIAVAKAPQCPYPLTPRYRRYWRTVTAPGNPHQASTTGGIATASGTALRMGNLASTVPLTGQLRPHQRSMANIGTAAFTWLITPACDVDQHHRHRSRGNYVRSGEV